MYTSLNLLQVAGLIRRSKLSQIHTSTHPQIHNSKDLLQIVDCPGTIGILNSTFNSLGHDLGQIVGKSGPSNRVAPD